MVHMIQDASKAGKSVLPPGIDGRIVTFHGKVGEAQLKAIVEGKDIVLYRYKRGLDLELRMALAQHNFSQKCGVLTSDAAVIAALDKANLGPDKNADGDPISKFDISIGQLTEAEQKRERDRPSRIAVD